MRESGFIPAPAIEAARYSYRAIRSVWRGGRAVKNRLLNCIDAPILVLAYHRVADLPSDPEMLAVSPANFRRQMEIVKENFTILRFEEEWPESKDPAVVVTFDDGYADNLLEALPILEEVGVPATFFVSTGYLGSDRTFWWHRLEEMLLREGDFPPRFVLKHARYGRAWDAGSINQRKNFYASLNLLMRKVDANSWEDWLEQVGEWSGRSGYGEAIHRSLTNEELKKLASSPWATIGAHTFSHSALSAQSEERQREEIFTPRDELETIIGREVTTFAYPFGRKQDYDRISVRLCREAGFIRAASNFPGQVHRWTDPFQVPRHLVRNWDPDTFSAHLKNFWTR